MMTFSVLMSVYKNDNPVFLQTALESIFDKQTLKPDEIVVVFDGPLTDELYAVLNDFQKGKEDIVKYYIETGYYIENLLPKLNVRLISITDHFDSSKDEDVHTI